MTTTDERPFGPRIFDLAGQTALVTGARRGIGRSMATALASMGADIVAVSASLEEHGSEVARQVSQLGRRIECHQVDLGDRKATDALLDDLERRGVTIDILVNNAGTILRAPAEKHHDEMWDEVLEVNLTAAFRLARRVGTGMLALGRGKIIFTASMLSFQGGITVASYTASKSAVAGIVKTLANEWASRGVNVNAIAPGYIATDNTEALRRDPDRNRAILERIPADRWGLPEDIAGAVVFLASRASDYVHGITLPVDGGWLGR